MALTLTLANLRSRAERIHAVGTTGIRRIALNGLGQGQDDQGFIVSLYNTFEKFGQSLMRQALEIAGQFLSWSATKIFNWIKNTVVFLLNFNWNTTDQQLDAQIKQAEIGVAATKGALIGQSLGYAVCGIIPTATIAVFNEPLALYIMAELGEEMAEELAASTANLISLQLQQQQKKSFAAFFKNHRTLLRSGAIGFAQGLVSLGILTQESVDKATLQRNQPWSIASALEESIESIENPVEQAYAEEFWEELGDACIEAGFIVAGSIDGYFAQQKAAAKSAFGDERIVEIELNRSLPAPTTNP